MSASATWFFLHGSSTMSPLRTTATAAFALLAGCATHSPDGTVSPDPLVGAWSADVTLVDCGSGQPSGALGFRAIVVFHAGGTLSEASGPSARRTPSFGTWQATKSGEYLAVSSLLTYDANGVPVGAQEIRRTIRLSADRRSFSADTRTLSTDTAGSVTFRGCARGEARRIE